MVEITEVNNSTTTEGLESDPWMLYIYGIKAPATKAKYCQRLRVFLEFIGYNDAECHLRIKLVHLLKKQGRIIRMLSIVCSPSFRCNESDSTERELQLEQFAIMPKQSNLSMKWPILTLHETR